jgi:MinD-like ATPase involved in chromosome partitioning or flagellar assembly
MSDLVAIGLGNTPLQDSVGDDLARGGQCDVHLCRTDSELLALVAERSLTGAVVGEQLIGLEARVLPALDRAQLPTVLLVSPRRLAARQAWLAEHYPEAPITALADTDPGTRVHAALAPRSWTRARPRASAESRPATGAQPARKRDTTRAQRSGRSIAVTGCAGSGCSTVVVNETAALGAGTSAIAVDLDLIGPSLVGLLARDDSLGLAGVVRADASVAEALDHALEAHLQPLTDGGRTPHGRLLGGLPQDGDYRPVPVSPDLVERLLAGLGRRARFVVIDIGQAVEPAQRVALLAADAVLLVTAGDRASVYRTRHYLATLIGGRAGLDPSRIALAINRHDPRTMDSPAAIARALALPLAVCITADTRRVNLALRDEQPVVLDGGGAISRQLIGLADLLAAPDWPPPRAVSAESWLTRLRRTLGLAPIAISVRLRGGGRGGARRSRPMSGSSIGKAGKHGRKWYEAPVSARKPAPIEAISGGSATTNKKYSSEMAGRPPRVPGSR